MGGSVWKTAALSEVRIRHWPAAPEVELLDMEKTGTKRQMNATVSLGDKLTDREVDILKRLFSGQCSTEVATVLNVSKRTVDFHLAKAYEKMGVKSRYDAYKKAIELGIITE